MVDSPYQRICSINPDYSDHIATSPDKVAEEGHPLISRKSSLVKYLNLARWMV